MLLDSPCTFFPMYSVQNEPSINNNILSHLLTIIGEFLDMLCAIKRYNFDMQLGNTEV